MGVRRGENRAPLASLSPPSFRAIGFANAQDISKTAILALGRELLGGYQKLLKLFAFYG
jgi:hypothetical protein